MTKLMPKMKALQKSIHLAYISNQSARQFILAAYGNNKLRFRSFVLDLAVGCTESKNTLKSTSFYTPTLFGPFPESFNARLESAFSASNKYNSFILKLPSTASRPTGRRYSSRSSSRESKRSRRDYSYPSPSLHPGDRHLSTGYSETARNDFFQGRSGKRKGSHVMHKDGIRWL